MISRRHLLNTSLASAGLLTAGCLGTVPEPGDDGTTDDDSIDDPPDIDWATIRGDPAMTGRRAAAHGPGDSLSLAWDLPVLSVVDEIESLTFDATDQRNFSQAEEINTARNSSPVLTDAHVVWTVAYVLADEDEANNDEGTSQSSARYRVRVVAADPSSGEIAWDHPVDWVTDRVGRSFPSPVVGPSGVYALGTTTDGLILDVLDPVSGNRTDQFELDMAPDPFQPVIADEILYFVTRTDDGRVLHAVDATNGEHRWSVAHPSLEPPTWPNVTVAADRAWYFERADEASALVGMDLADGSVQVRIPVDLPEGITLNGGRTHLASPVIVDGFAYLAGSFDVGLQRDRAPLVAIDFEAETVEWTATPPETVIDGHGEEVGAMYGMPLVLDDVIVATGVGAPENSPDSRGYLFGVDRRSGELDWAVPDVLDPLAAPVAAGDTIYLPTSSTGEEYAISAISATGEVLETLSTPIQSPVSGPPAMGGGRSFYASMLGMIAIE